MESLIQPSPVVKLRSLSLHGLLDAVTQHLQKSLRAWWSDGKILSRRAITWVARHRLLALFYLSSCALTVGSLMSVDVLLLHQIQQACGCDHLAFVHQVAVQLSYWGDFLGFSMLIFVALGVTARLRQSLFFRRLVIAAVIGTISTGAVANISRLLTGRARPGHKGAAGFHGPSFKSSLQSFPSAHTATAFGASVPIAIALPPVGVPMLLIAASVSWSRIQNNRHHPSDVFMSIALAFFFGLPLGVVVRRMRRVELQRRRMRTASVQLDLAPLKPTMT